MKGNTRNDNVAIVLICDGKDDIIMVVKWLAASNYPKRVHWEKDNWDFNISQIM